MIKAKFGDSLRSKTKIAQTNEALCKQKLSVEFKERLAAMKNAGYERSILANYMLAGGIAGRV